MLRRFFCSPPIDSNHVTIVDSEAHHLIHVLRAQPGDRVELFDGSGLAFEAEIREVHRKHVDLHILSRYSSHRELPFPLTLMVALPRGDRQDWLIQKAVEIGVTQLVPWTTQRGVAQPNTKTLLRLRRGVIEASKQCRRDHLMRVAEPVEFAKSVRTTSSTNASADARYLAHVVTDGTKSLHQHLQTLGTLQHGVTIGIGPEGGFSDEEAAIACEQGWQLAILGRTILRTETAAIAAAALVALQVDGANQ